MQRKEIYQKKVSEKFPSTKQKYQDWKCLAKLMKTEPQQQQQKRVTEISKHWQDKNPENSQRKKKQVTHRESGTTMASEISE